MADDINEDMFKQFIGQPAGPAPAAPPVSATPAPAPASPPVVNPDMFKPSEGRLYVPVNKEGVDWSRYNEPFGTVAPKAQDYDEALRSKVHDTLMRWGANPYMGRKMADTLVDAANVSPIGSVTSALNVPYHAGEGNYVRAGLDLLGTIPGVMMARRGIQALRGTLPQITMAPTPTRTIDEVTGRANDELLNASRTNYGRINQAPIEYHPDAGSHFGDIAQHALENTPDPFGRVIPREAAPNVFNLLQRRGDELAARGGPITPQDWDILRQQLRAFDPNTPEGAAGARAAEILDSYMYHPPPGALTYQGAPGAMDFVRANMEAARGDYRAGKTAEVVERAIDRAGTKAARANSGLNLDNVTRQQLSALTTTDAGLARISGSTYPERQAIDAVVAGDPVTNKLRYMSNRMGGGGGFTGTFGGGIAGHTVNSLLGSWGIDPVTATGVGMASGYLYPKAGEALRRVANQRTVNAAEGVVDTIRQNSPLFQARVLQDPYHTSPYAMNTDAIAYALLPKAAQAAQGAYDQARVPYENRDDSESWSPQ